jgi:hypothetical protein
MIQEKLQRNEKGKGKMSPDNTYKGALVFERTDDTHNSPQVHARPTISPLDHVQIVDIRTGDNGGRGLGDDIA